MQVNIFKLKDKAQTSGSSLKVDDENDIQLAHDSVLSIKLQGIQNLPEDIIPSEMRDKVYIQVLIEDDTFNSQVRLKFFSFYKQFGRPSSQQQGFLDIDFYQETLNVKIPKLALKSDAAQIFLIIRLNDQEGGISYLDKLISSVTQAI